MRPGERQVAETSAGIRRDHVARYEFAARMLPERSRVIDFACGVGYGCDILAAAGHSAHGFDNDAEALSFARAHYANSWRTRFSQADGETPLKFEESEAAVCFETIEHLRDPRPLLRALRQAAPVLIASVPNEAVMPFSPAPGVTTAYHYRHCTKAEFEALLKDCGWIVHPTGWYGQAGPESEVEHGGAGRTLIAYAYRAEQAKAAPEPASAAEKGAKHISIVGLGPSSAQYVDLCKRLGGRRKFCDETWAINALGAVLDCDKVFHMDDVRIQEIRAAAEPTSNIAGMLEWLKTHPGPIVTSRAHPDYPGLVEFPLEDVVNACPTGYFNSTAAYAVALAIHVGATRISLFGCDFTYPDAHDAEKGRACVEFWLGIAAERGIQITVPKTTSLLDALHSQAERFYGYDCVDLDIQRVDGRIKVGFTERAELPSAEEIEARYDHTRHPSPLVSD